MTDLVPFNGGGFLQTRTERQTSRALEQVRSRQAIATAQEIARVEIIADTSQAALLAASHVSLLEELLATRTSRVAAAERLRHIADAGALGMTEVVLNAGRRCR